ncbi:MAG: hypothetical protein WC969_08135 [Elusimicrobiota bacterium]|jgi:hypothetical protein
MPRGSAFFAVLFCAGLAAARAADAPVLRERIDALFCAQLDDGARASLPAGSSYVDAARFLDPAGRQTVRAGLLPLEKGEDETGLIELASAYLAAGWNADAERLLLALGKGPATSPGILALKASLLLQAGRYPEAAEAARETLKLSPGYPPAVTTLKLSERHLAGKTLRLPSSAKKEDPAVAIGASRRGAAALASTTAARRSVFEPPSAYHMPDTKKPGFFGNLYSGIKSLWDAYAYEPSPKETAAFAKMRASLQSTGAGADLIERMGGWEGVDKNILFIYTDLGKDGTLAYVRPLTPGEQKKSGKKFMLAMHARHLDSPPEVVVPVFAHELTHVYDHLVEFNDHRLALASEHGAHLRQMYVFQELTSPLTPARRAELMKDKIFRHQEWLLTMWIDHLLSKYPTKESYQASFGDDKKLRYLSGLAYEDIAKKAIGDGTPQLLYHVSDLYAAATNEQEVTERELTDALAGEKDPARRARIEALLKDLRSMRGRFLGIDQRYREKTGQTLP